MVTAPTRILSQSASVFGTRSIVPRLVVSIFTASKMLSDAGSSMSRMSSLTDTTGFMSPHRTGVAGGAAGEAGFGDEHAGSSTPTQNSAAT